MLLPYDILDHIFSFLQSDPATLEACSQSHPEFIHLVERHLYASITLYDKETPLENGHGTRQFIRFLSDNPHIANHIRNMEIKVTLELPESTQYLEDIASVLRKCSLLTQITLNYGNFWSFLPDNFRSAFLDCLTRLSMRVVSILYVFGFPLEALNGFEGVKSLKLIGWRNLEFFAKPPSLPLLVNTSIHDVDVRPIPEIIDWMQTRNLQSLEVTLPYLASEIRFFSGFLSSCTDNLTNLTLDFEAGYRNRYKYQMGTIAVIEDKFTTIPITLSSLKRLEKLTIAAQLRFINKGQIPDVYEFDSPISAISQLLKTAPPLRHLTLGFCFFVPLQFCLPSNPDAVWSPLISLMSESPSSYITLRISARTLSKSRLVAISWDRVHSMLSSCTRIRQMVEQGVLTVIPADPTAPVDVPE